MARTGRPGLSAEQKRELWTRWKDGQSLSDIGRALGKHAASVFGVLAAKGGIAPPVKTRSRLSLTAEEREEVSRDLVAGCSLRQIAARLGRAPSTVSREVGRNLVGQRHGDALAQARRGQGRLDLIDHQPRRDTHDAPARPVTEPPLDWYGPP